MHLLIHIERSIRRLWSRSDRACAVGNESSNPAVDRMFLAPEDAPPRSPGGRPPPAPATEARERYGQLRGCGSAGDDARQWTTGAVARAAADEADYDPRPAG